MVVEVVAVSVRENSQRYLAGFNVVLLLWSLNSRSLVFCCCLAALIQGLSGIGCQCVVGLWIVR